jgi:hypothetical protein
MAKKQYREAIEAFREGSAKDPVLCNKSGNIPAPPESVETQHNSGSQGRGSR